MSNAPPPPTPVPAPIDAAAPPPLTGSSSSAPPASGALPMPLYPSMVPITATSDVHALSVPPGVTITHEPPPPSLALQLVASLPDTAAIVVVGVLMGRHIMGVDGGIGAIFAVLAARAKPVRLGAQAVSGVATLILGALRTTVQPKTPPASPAQ